MTTPLVANTPQPEPGADGQIHRVVSLCLQRVVPTPAQDPTAAVIANDPYSRDFDLAELISWACMTAGVRPVPPTRSDLLAVYCRAGRTIVNDPAEALRTKGALLFTADNSVGLSLGLRGQVIVYSPATAVVVDNSGVRRWVWGARIPFARGYPL